MGGKANYNYLVGWCRQLRQALDEGVELGYEVAELIDEAIDLITEPSSDPELGDAESGGDGEGDDGIGGHDEVHQEGLLRDEPRMGGRLRSAGDQATRVDAAVAGRDPDVAGAASGDAGRVAGILMVPGKRKHATPYSQR